MTKEEAYEKATLQQIGNNPVGTRQDIIYAAMDIYSESLISSLTGIAQCSDCGSETAAIIVMKRIASEALSTHPIKQANGIK